MKKILILLLGICSLQLLGGETVALSKAQLSANEALFSVNNLWIMLGGMLVFIMHLGFACVETGLTRAKNCSNILFKNTLTPAIGFLTYGVCGFAIMYPGTQWICENILGFAGFGLHLPTGASIDYASGNYTYWTDFFFQGMFAATAATIVSGAVAERIELKSYLLFTAIFVSLAYPVVGSWGWGGGWLSKLSFHDFAGSTFVHSVGGWAALAGILLLGPRIGKYVNGVPTAIMGHNMPLATIGVFLLWFGWFGFNGASALSANPNIVSLVLVNTMLAACAGIVMSLATSKIVIKNADLSMTLNGCLAGLVGITASADCVSPLSAVIIGGIAGILVVVSVLLFDRILIDDPVGALSVHLVCGVWGTLAVGIFSFDNSYSLLSQVIGVLSVGLISFSVAFIIFYILKKTIGLRVSETHEMRGLDISEHSTEAYNGFQVFSNM